MRTTTMHVANFWQVISLAIGLIPLIVGGTWSAIQTHRQAKRGDDWAQFRSTR